MLPSLTSAIASVKLSVYVVFGLSGSSKLTSRFFPLILDLGMEPSGGERKMLFGFSMVTYSLKVNTKVMPSSTGPRAMAPSPRLATTMPFLRLTFL